MAMSEFQREVLFRQGDGYLTLGEGTRALAHSEQMDELVGIICRTLGCAPLSEGGNIGFKVWRNGICWSIYGSYPVRLGKYPKLSEVIYRNKEMYGALQYRGKREGFELIRNSISGLCGLNKSTVIMFVHPSK